MVKRSRTDINEMFVQALYLDDMPLLKTILEGMKYTSVKHLQNMLVAKAELGGFSPFEFACLQGNASLATILIDLGNIDVNKSGQFDWTPLHTAAYSGDLKTVQVLVNSCADCFARDENNNLPIDLTKDGRIRDLLTKTMKMKNMTKFEQILNDCKSSRLQREDRFHQRSKSCFANISVIKMNELKTQLVERKQSSGEFTKHHDELIKNELRRWSTCADLTLDSIFDLSC